MLVTSGISQDAPLEYWDGLRWWELGRLSGGRMKLSAELRPYLIRYVPEHGPVSQAIVHRTEQLRVQRMKPRATSRAADVIPRLPLDLEGVRVLESVLADLYLLGELGVEAALELRRRRRNTEEEPEAELSGLTEWMPARADEEPRVPDIYRRAWTNAPDALLAMIRHALRLDRGELIDERDLREESLGLDEAEVEEAEQLAASEPEATETPPVDEKVLRRYRNELVKLLERGVNFVGETPEPALADLAFQVILRLHEKLEKFKVDVVGEERPLVDQQILLRQKLALLEAYLKERGGRDPQCLATARVHLSACLADRSAWSPGEWERLERLAYKTGAEVLASSRFVSEAAEDAGATVEDITARLKPYADRSEWSGYVVEADRYLDDTDLGTEPFPWVRGFAWFDELATSPAWRIIGYGAVVAYAEKQRYAVIIENENAASPRRRHVLLCDPSKSVLFEAFNRRTDGHWLVRTYSGASEGMIDYARRIGPEALNDANRSPFNDVGEGGLLEGPLGELALMHGVVITGGAR